MPSKSAPQSTLRTPAELARAGLIADDSLISLNEVAARYAVAVTPSLVEAIGKEAADGPLRRQFIPSAHELVIDPREAADPIGDARHEAVPGVVHRYRDRVLLKLTHACPVYCRFCFRREMVGPGGENILGDAALSRALAYIEATPAIFEVIVTGGDPLILSPRRIADVTARLDAIAHVQLIRWHTRVPVVDPDRVTEDLVASLRATRKAVFVGIHANHASEFTEAARAAIARLADGGLSLVSQTVLLKGINDDVETMEALMRTFVANRVKPYYLHHADLAPGTGHFRTTIDAGQALMRQLRQRLSGLAQPTYILDIPGGVAKVPIGPAYLDRDDGGEALTIRDPQGGAHAYGDRG